MNVIGARDSNVAHVWWNIRTPPPASPEGLAVGADGQYISGGRKRVCVFFLEDVYTRTQRTGAEQN